jgi:hypothetical protein
MDKYDEMINRSTQSTDWLETAPRVESAKIENGRLVLMLISEVVVSVPLSLLRIGQRVPSSVEILGGGLDVYFPENDEAVFVPDLLAGIISMKLAA